MSVNVGIHRSMFFVLKCFHLEFGMQKRCDKNTKTNKKIKMNKTKKNK